EIGPSPHASGGQLLGVTAAARVDDAHLERALQRLLDRVARAGGDPPGCGIDHQEEAAHERRAHPGSLSSSTPDRRLDSVLARSPEQCICDMPSALAISLWVRPSNKRSKSM